MVICSITYIISTLCDTHKTNPIWVQGNQLGEGQLVMDDVGNIINDNDDASDSKVLPGWFYRKQI